jgi:lysophospholipase L1-like esterase
VRRLVHIVVAALLATGWSSVAASQNDSQLAPVPKSCDAPGATVIVGSPLPNVAAILKERRKLTILAIGSTSASARGPVSGGHYAVVEKFLEDTFKGLDVEIVHRGVSGELAADAAERIKTEAALAGADLVLWQVGTADALARVPLEDFQATLTQTVQWLKEHKIDVILVGLRYARGVVKDAHYQAVRKAIQSVAKEQDVLRIGRYEAQETLERIRREAGVMMGLTEATEAEYVCMAEYLARAIAAGLFVKRLRIEKPSLEKQP